MCVGVGAHLAGWAAGAAAGGRLRERGLRSEDGGPLVRTSEDTAVWRRILCTDNQTRPHRRVY